MFQSSSPVEGVLEEKKLSRKLNADRFAKIIKAFKTDGYIYTGEGAFSIVGSFIGADGTDVLEYLKSIKNDEINTQFLFEDRNQRLIDSIVFAMCAEETLAERSGSKVSDTKFQECLEELIKKGAVITSKTYLLAQKRGANLFEMWCRVHLQRGAIISATNILDAFAHNISQSQGCIVEEQLRSLLFIYYRYEQRDREELLPIMHKLGFDVLSIYEQASKEKDAESYSSQTNELFLKKAELERLTQDTELKLEAYTKAYTLSENARHQHEALELESVKFHIRKLQERCAKYTVDSLRLSEEIDVLIKQRTKNSEQKAKLEGELELFNTPILEESRVVQGVGQVRQLNSAINLTKQEQIVSLGSANDNIAIQIQEKRKNISLYRQAYDNKLTEIEGLQKKLLVCKELGARIEEWVPKAKGSHAVVKEWFADFLSTTHLQYQGVDCNALCIASMEKNISVYFQCLYSAIPIIGYHDEKNCNIMHRFFECLSERSKINDKLGEGSTVLNRHIIFSLLFLPDLAVSKNQDGKTPIEVASGYLKGKTNFYALAEEFVSR